MANWAKIEIIESYLNSQSVHRPTRAEQIEESLAELKYKALESIRLLQIAHSQDNLSLKGFLTKEALKLL